VARDKIAVMQVGTQPERVAAMLTGRIEATVLEPGFGQAARDKGLTLMLDLTTAEAPYLNTVLVASRRYIKENPQQTEVFLKGTIDGLGFLSNPVNERAVKSVLARRLKLTTPESIQIMYDATVQIHAKSKSPYATVPGVQNMIDALSRVNPRLAKMKAVDMIDNSFIEKLDKIGYIAETMKRR
jgi:ABC-type nitrate/sulfonate/bicarbonate transport system substrate-binding protein